MRRTKPIPLSSLKVKRSSAGLGLFATSTISPGEYIEYTGEIITTEKANSMVGARYLFELNSKWTIQGAGRDNLARYINYSCEPNCESTQVGKRVFIMALQPIKPGEELTYDYGDEYFDEFIKPHGCRCGSCLKKS